MDLLCTGSMVSIFKHPMVCEFHVNNEHRNGMWPTWGQKVPVFPEKLAAPEVSLLVFSSSNSPCHLLRTLILPHESSNSVAGFMSTSPSVFPKSKAKVKVTEVWAALLWNLVQGGHWGGLLLSFQERKDGERRFGFCWLGGQGLKAKGKKTSGQRKEDSTTCWVLDPGPNILESHT